MMDMNLFSLEEDDGNELFLTQVCKEHKGGDVGEDDEFLRLMNSSQLGIRATDFQSPCVSLRERKNYDPVYEDISDEEFQGNDGLNEPNFE